IAHVRAIVSSLGHLLLLFFIQALALVSALALSRMAKCLALGLRCQFLLKTTVAMIPSELVPPMTRQLAREAMTMQGNSYFASPHATATAASSSTPPRMGTP